MRLLHASDWHLGRSFHRVGLFDAQAAHLDHLVDVVRAERVDAVLVAGDVYDRALPSPETVQLLDDALVRLTEHGAQVVLSSGNHDSAIRLGFASRLLARGGVHIRTDIASVGRPVLVGDVAVYPIPYLEPSVAATALGAGSRTHADVLAAAMQRVRADLVLRPGPSVVMAHAFVTGGATSGSERDISVGGVGAVHPDVFDGVDYVALGHLHGAQRLADRVRYSGSPLAMSFSESAQTKGAWLVDVGGAGARAVEATRVTYVAAPVPRPLAILRGELEELLRDPRHRAAEAAWCQVTLTDAVRPLDAMDRVRRRFPHTLVLQFDPARSLPAAPSYAQRTRHRSDLDLCCDFLEHVRGGAAASVQERRVLAEAVEHSRVGHTAAQDEGVAAEGTGTTKVGRAQDPCDGRRGLGAA